MSGWVLAVALTALTGAGLWRFGRLPPGAAGFIAAAMAVALAGYAWQGRPEQPGAPVAPPSTAVAADTPFARERLGRLDRFGTTGQWLDFADALERMGEHRAAVNALKGALKQNPRDAGLWVGLGNALVVHADGQVTPAARLAFDRAIAIAPASPAPSFFLGLAMAQSGEFDQAATIWRGLLARSPADAPYREDLRARLAELDMMRAIR